MKQKMWAVYGVQTNSHYHPGISFWLIACYPYKEQAEHHLHQLAEYFEDLTNREFPVVIAKNIFDPEKGKVVLSEMCYGITELSNYSGFDEFQEEHNI